MRENNDFIIKEIDMETNWKADVRISVHAY